MPEDSNTPVRLETLDALWTTLLRQPPNDRHAFVFRGEPQVFSRVRPALDRVIEESLSGDQRLSYEVSLIRRFTQLAGLMLPLGEREILHEGVQALVVMQHYGVPTRLLDWTASPWIALYFACESSPSEDGRVLRLCRSALQHNVGERFADETNAHANGPNGEIRMFTDSFVSSASDWVVCYHRHAEQFPRLVAQQGLFTIASKPMLDHWLVANSLVAPRLNAEFIIPAMLKRSVMQMLEMAGITHASLFPGVEGVAGYLKRSARYELSLT